MAHEVVVLTAKYLVAVSVAVSGVWWALVARRDQRIRYLIVLVAGGVLAYVFSKIGGHLYSDPLSVHRRPCDSLLPIREGQRLSLGPHPARGPLRCRVDVAVQPPLVSPAVCHRARSWGWPGSRPVFITVST